MRQDRERKAPEGVVTAMVTPFTGDGDLDLRRAGELARHLVGCGSEALVLGATTGEGPVLTDAERLALWDRVLEEVGSQVPVWVSAGSNDPVHACDLAREAQDHGVDRLLVVTPYYNRPPQEGLYAHYARVAAASDLPLVLYDVPSRTACHLLPETVLRLAEDIPTVRGLKAAHPDLAETAEILRHRPDSFALWSGDDAFTFALMALGGDGVVSVAAHVVGSAMAELVRAMHYGDLPVARTIHLNLLPLFQALFLTTNPIPVKAALAFIGQDAGPVRPPLCPLTDAQSLRLRAALREVGLTLQPEFGR